MGIEIRNVGPDDAEAMVEVTSTAFLEHPDVRAVAALVRETWDPARSWLAWDGGRVCGTFRSWETEITVPGHARLPAAAVAAVTVLPTHRRRGILSAMAGREHRAALERGDAMALLYCSEFSIYGRFGYGPGTRHGTWTIDTRATKVLPPAADEGTVELATPSAAVKDVVRDLYEEWRATQVGEIRRREHGWELRLGLRPEPWGDGWKGWLVLHRSPAGAVDGFLRYAATSREHGQLPGSEVTVNELVALDDAAETALWRYATSIDLVATVKAGGRSPSDRLPWRVTNPRAATLSEVIDALWVRLLDVPRSLAARRYERAGSLVLEVVDEHTTGALAQAARLFRTEREPWCSTYF